MNDQSNQRHAALSLSVRALFGGAARPKIMPSHLIVRARPQTEESSQCPGSSMTSTRTSVSP